MMSPDSRQTSLKSSHSNSFAFTNFNSAQQTACFVQKERKSVIFFFLHYVCKSMWLLDPYLCPEGVALPGAGWFQRYRGRDPAWPKPPQGLCSQYTGCLFWFLPWQSPRNNKKKNCENKDLMKNILLYCQQGYKKSQPLSQRVQHSTYLAHPPHHMRPLWVGQTEIRAHHQQLRGCPQPQLLWLSVRQSNHVEVRFTQYLSTLRTLWKVTDSSNTVSMYTSSTMAWSSFLKGGKWRRRRDNVKIKSAALTNLCFISLMIVNDKTNAT